MRPKENVFKIQATLNPLPSSVLSWCRATPIRKAFKNQFLAILEFGVVVCERRSYVSGGQVVKRRVSQRRPYDLGRKRMQYASQNLKESRTSRQGRDEIKGLYSKSVSQTISGSKKRMGAFPHFR